LSPRKGARRMSDREHHCPFLNRADHRCAGFFSIEGLQHAFEHCFDAYKSCGVYAELLAERQAARAQAASGHAGAGAMRFLWATACTSPEAAADVKRSAGSSAGRSGPGTQFVQVRLPSVASHHVTGSEEAVGASAGR
jgi:hypothetical protein